MAKVRYKKAGVTSIRYKIKREWDMSGHTMYEVVQVKTNNKKRTTYGKKAFYSIFTEVKGE